MEGALPGPSQGEPGTSFALVPPSSLRPLVPLCCLSSGCPQEPCTGQKRCWEQAARAALSPLTSTSLWIYPGHTESSPLPWGLCALRASLGAMAGQARPKCVGRVSSHPSVPRCDHLSLCLSQQVEGVPVLSSLAGRHLRARWLLGMERRVPQLPPACLLWLVWTSDVHLGS